MDTKVIDSRLVGEGDQIRRRRECTECSERFTSYESAELNYPRIIKSDNRREQFSEDKLRAGIMRALEKRPVEMDRVELAVSHIEHKLRALGEREVKARKIGDWVMEELNAETEEVNADSARDTADAIANLKIAGVRPKQKVIGRFSSTVLPAPI